MPRPDPRAVALAALVEIESKQAFSDAVLSSHLDASGLDGPDRGLATQLVYGSLARRLTLDHTIEAYSERTTKKLDAGVHELIRIGLFQLAFLDRVPSHAAVNSTVELAKDVAPRAAGFINAILRRCSRDGLAPPPTDRFERLAIEHSHPVWLIERWIELFGETEAIALMAADNNALPTILRALIGREEAAERLAEIGAGTAPCERAPDGLVAAKPIRMPGVAIPQSEASQLVVRLLAPKPGESILDACAAPGGKTAYIAALVGEAGRVTACDPGRNAKRRVTRLLTSCGVADRVSFHAAAVEDLDSDAGFDAVLVDAPCSGLGTLSEHPEIRWRRTPEDLSDLAARQGRILDASAARVASGGRLVYSTCTLVAEENDEVVDAFLARTPDFRPDDLPPAPECADLIDEHSRMRTYPHRHGMQGFFAAALRRA
jgi:16S rRNA (cytosine967-C5)-methyltransferase